MVEATRMGDFEGGVGSSASVPCPGGCGGMMHPESHLCAVCSAKERTRVQAEAWQEAHDAGMLERHHRFTAALEAGWEMGELIAMLPRLPTDEEIAERQNAS